jgi:hypothetical protein
MKNEEWLSQLAKLTGLPYYQQHRIFGDKSGALVGASDGYLVAVGLGKVDGRHAAVKIVLRFAKTQVPQQVQQGLDPAKGKFKLVTDETTATLTRTYSFAKPDAPAVAEDLRNLLGALKTCASGMNGKCEECGPANLATERSPHSLLFRLPSPIEPKARRSCRAIRKPRNEPATRFALRIGGGAAGQHRLGRGCLLAESHLALGRNYHWDVRWQGGGEGNWEGDMVGPHHDRFIYRRQCGVRRCHFLRADRGKGSPLGIYASLESGSLELLGH